MQRPSKTISAMAAAVAILLAACASAAGETDSTGTDDTSAQTTVTSESDATSDTTATSDDTSAEQASTTVNQESHYEASDLEWDESSATAIVLDGDGASANGDGVSVDGSTVTISAPGAYVLTGQLDGQVVVDSAAEGNVQLILDGVTITNDDGAAIAVMEADEVVVILADGSTNQLSDGAEYTFPDADTDEPNATLYSKADTTIAGIGTLVVEGAYNDGITSKDGLVIVSGTIVVDAVDDGIRGKDYVIIHDGSITVTAGGDGIKSDNDEDAERGYVAVESGTVTIDAGGDGIDAETDVDVTGGVLSVTTAGGASGSISGDDSAKGIKGSVSVTIDDAEITIDAADDAVHSNGSIVMTSGTVEAASGDDGFHADEEITITGGSITITESYEGLEATVIRITDGDIDITSSDDGINIAGGQDGSGTAGRPGRGGGPDQFAANADYWLYIEGGTITIDAGGDGLDSNGSVDMSGGLVVIDGPTQNMNGALDVNGSFTVTGGILSAAGSAGMAETPNSGGQAVLAITFNGSIQADTLITIQAGDGTVIAAVQPTKTFQSLVFSSPDLVSGGSYVILVGGSATGDQIGSLYLDASVSGASEAGSLTAS